MPNKTILIFTAMQMEAQSIQRALPETTGDIHTIGIRATRLPPIEQIQQAGLILVCGVAGALDPGLEIGDVVFDAPEQMSPAVDSFHRGKIHTATGIIATPADKARLFQQTGALAVDMEQAIVRTHFRQLNIPVIGLRTISDSAGHVVDPAVIGMVDDLGRPRPANVAMQLLRQPALIGELRELNRNTKTALQQLGVALKSFLASHAR